MYTSTDRNREKYYSRSDGVDLVEFSLNPAVFFFFPLVGTLTRLFVDCMAGIEENMIYEENSGCRYLRNAARHNILYTHVLFRNTIISYTLLFFRAGFLDVSHMAPQWTMKNFRGPQKKIRYMGVHKQTTWLVGMLILNGARVIVSFIMARIITRITQTY